MPQEGEIQLYAQKSCRKPRRRAAIACQACNGKRVKCNAASVGLPCSNCQRSGKSCQFIKSRRGQRKKKEASERQNDRTTEVHRQTTSESPVASNHRVNILARDESHEEGQTARGQQDIVEPSGSVDAGKVWKSGRRQATPTDALQPSDTEHGNPTNYITHSVLAISPHTQRSPYAQPSDIGHSNILEVGHEEYNLLAAQQAFKVPKSDVCSQLFQAFFTHVTPSFPIIDRTNFILQYAIVQRPPSCLLLQAILFSATGHCEESLLREAGFESRSRARALFFKRAKALYDADHEKDKFTIVQATFLMSFWWDSILDTKDNWHWLGLAINLALTIGLHRSTKDSGMPVKTQKLWKRMWWSLFAEDKYQSVALGRPLRLRSCDCNVEALEMADFEGEPYGFGHSFRVGLPKLIMAYPICSTSLAKIAERITEPSSHVSNIANGDLALCDGMLQVWEAGLPEFYQLRPHDRIDNIWASMIQISACWLRILLYHTNLRVVFPIPFLDNVHQKAIEAANQMVRHIENLLGLEQIQLCPIHIIPAVYAAMNILARTVRSGRSLFQRLAHVKYKVCVVALQELESVWPISRRILSAFAENMSSLNNERSLQ